MTQHPLHLLMVDDSDDDATLMVAALRRAGFAPVWKRVAEAAALTEALVPEQHWDVITCDSGLPQLDAVSVIGAAHRALPTVPVLLVTGRYPVELQREIPIVSGFVNKDHLEDLPAMVRAVIGTHH
jgi:two-component system, NarL family, sensor histidine kinase UhpB